MVDLRRVNFNFVDVRVEVGIRIRTSTCDSLSPFVGTPPPNLADRECPQWRQIVHVAASSQTKDCWRQDKTFVRVTHARPDAIQLQWVMSMSGNCEQWHEHCFCHVISWLGADYGTSGHFKARVMLTCTDGVSPNHLPVIVPSDRPWATLSTRAH